MIGNSELEALGDKLQTTLVDLMRCREREAKYRHESQTLLGGCHPRRCQDAGAGAGEPYPGAQTLYRL